MTGKLRPLVAGNWKMNGLRAALGEIGAVAAHAAGTQETGNAELLVCPPATLLMAAAGICGQGPVRLGGQDCHAAPFGAHTGDISAEMLADAGAAYVILGHSERRADHGESNETVRAKAEAALRAGLTPIVCVGESLAEREAGEALPAVVAQLKGSLPPDAAGSRLVVAYEPIWAIGTGLTPSAEDAARLHAVIRQELMIQMGASGREVRVLYGGSVKPDNAAVWAALNDVNGVLVGGASLKAEDFLAIAKAFA